MFRLNVEGFYEGVKNLLVARGSILEGLTNQITKNNTGTLEECVNYVTGSEEIRPGVFVCLRGKYHVRRIICYSMGDF